MVIWMVVGLAFEMENETAGKKVVQMVALLVTFPVEYWVAWTEYLPVFWKVSKWAGWKVEQLAVLWAASWEIWWVCERAGDTADNLVQFEVVNLDIAQAELKEII